MRLSATLLPIVSIYSWADDRNLIVELLPLPRRKKRRHVVTEVRKASCFLCVCLLALTHLHVRVISLCLPLASSCSPLFLSWEEKEREREREGEKIDGMRDLTFLSLSLLRSKLESKHS